MLRPVEGLTFPHRVGIVSPQDRYSELVGVYLVSFSLWLHAGFPHRVGIPGALCGRFPVGSVFRAALTPTGRRQRLTNSRTR
jgi:hypothetical protein